MVQKSIAEIVSLIEEAPGNEEVDGLVERYRDVLVGEGGTDAIVKRLEDRRDMLRRWEGVTNLIKRLQMRQVGKMRHDLETATVAVLQAEGATALTEVAKEHPIVFSTTFLNTLRQLHQEAIQNGDDYTQNLVANRLKHLQLLHLANSQGMELSPAKLKTIVFQILETRSFHDLLERISEYRVVFAETFDEIMRDIAREGAGSDSKLPKVAELRIKVLAALRAVVEAIVRRQKPAGGPEDAVEALNKVKDADEFIRVVAGYPFVLGEDFLDVLVRELERARAEGDEKAVQGLERRKGHLQLIGRIVTELTAEPLPTGESGE